MIDTASLKRRLLVGMILATAIMTSVGQAGADYKLEAWVMGSAGSSSFTVGEPGVGRSSGGGYENCAGFWCVARGIDQAFSAYVTLVPGLNLFGMPVVTPPAYSAVSLLTELAEPATGEVFRYLPASSQYQGYPGSDFGLADTEGYLLYLTSGKTVRFAGARACPTTLSLEAGLNVVTIPCTSATLKAHALLGQLESANPGAVASIIRFNTDSGQFETVSFSGADIVGPDFYIRRGEAYLLNMNAAVASFSPSL